MNLDNDGATAGDEGFQPVRRRRCTKNTSPYPTAANEEKAVTESVANAMADGGDASGQTDDALLKPLPREEDEDMASESESTGDNANNNHTDNIKIHGKKQNRSRKRNANKADDPFIRRVRVPPHRLTPLREQWLNLLQPLVMHMRLQVRMNLKQRCVELRTAPPKANGPDETTAMSNISDDNTRLEKGSEYVRAFMLGFELRDCVALLRLDDMYLESFEVHDVKRLTGAHFSRCIGRLTGRSGSTKFAIENATRTRVVVAGRKIHILGSFDCIKLARHSICSLILGKPQGKVYSHLRTVAKRLSQRV